MLGLGAAVISTLCPCCLAGAALTSSWLRQNYKQMSSGMGWGQWSNVRSPDIVLCSHLLFVLVSSFSLIFCILYNHEFSRL